MTDSVYDMISALLIATTALLSEQSTAFVPSQLSNRIIQQRPCNSQSTQLYLGDFFNFGKDDKPKDTTTTTEEETEEDDGLYYDNDDPIEKIFGERIYCGCMS